MKLSNRRGFLPDRFIEHTIQNRLLCDLDRPYRRRIGLLCRKGTHQKNSNRSLLKIRGQSPNSGKILGTVPEFRRPS